MSLTFINYKQIYIKNTTQNLQEGSIYMVRYRVNLLDNQNFI